MKIFLVTLKNSLTGLLDSSGLLSHHRLQYGISIASVAILSENAGFPVIALREISKESADAFFNSGMKWGMA